MLVHTHGWHSHEKLASFTRSALRGKLLPRAVRVGKRPSFVLSDPTDFIVLEVSGKPAAARAHRILLRHTLVHSVSPQRRYLLATPQLPPRRVRAARMPHDFITQAMNASRWWDRGASGAGVRIAIFDTGLNADHRRFLRHRATVVDFTDERTTDDRVGHSTFMAGTIASVRDCKGFAPDAEITSVRVFDSQQSSTTAWFLDGFNYILHRADDIDIINLSVGGPDFRDAPFAAKVAELASKGVTIISGAGNSGPTWGTLLNPADEAWVVGVGGALEDGSIASWSSRGPTLWEQPHGAGRMGVDVVALGEFWAAHPSGGCQHQWGTSVACPVVVGVLALLLSALGPADRSRLRSPAAVKQVLARSSERIGGASHLEQGSGQLRPEALFDAMRAFTPHVSSLPPSLDLTDCPYMEPYCSSPLFVGSQPLVFNVTLLDSNRPDGTIRQRPLWRPRGGAGGMGGGVLSVRFTYESQLRAWSGFLGVEVSVASDAAEWEGTVHGDIELVVDEGLINGREPGLARRRLLIPVSVRVARRPPRHRRLLFDLFHSAGYPAGFFPVDDLSGRSEEMMDLHGDHPHTNYRSLSRELREAGFSVELLGGDFTTFNASDYGALLLLDPEEPFLPLEERKLRDDIRLRGLGLLVAADWFDPKLMRALYFREEHTSRPNHCAMGGSNVPALNTLLAPFGIAYQTRAFSGDYMVSTRRVAQRTGTAIARAPTGAFLLSAALSPVVGLTDSGGERRADPIDGAKDTVDNNGHASAASAAVEQVEQVGVLALHGQQSGGWILAMTDSSCLDDEQPPHAAVSSSPDGGPQRGLHCRSVTVALLTQILSDSRAAPGAGGVAEDSGNAMRRPDLLWRAERLDGPIFVEEPYSRSGRQRAQGGMRRGRGGGSTVDGLTAAQVHAFHSSSRVWSQIHGCTTQSKNCTLPLVPPPRWLDATAGTPVRGEPAVHWRSGSDDRVAQPELSLGLVTHGLVVLVCAAGVYCRLVPAHARRCLSRAVRRERRGPGRARAV
jgi:hypothetical protein